MSDPYNSYGSQIPPLVQSADAPKPPPPPPKREKPDLITRLDVSDKWKERFRLIEKAGGPKLPYFKQLSFSERMKLNFNVFAYFMAWLLGPVYYLCKGLWKQAISYFAITLLCIFIFDAMGWRLRGISTGMAVVYSLRANVSYYRKKVLGELPWF